MTESGSTYAFGTYVLDSARRTLRCGDDDVPLSPKAFDLLAVLARHSGTVVAKDTLLRTVWPGTVVDESNLAFQISTLRKVLGDGARYIVTVPGRGYQLAEPVRTAEAPESIVQQRTEKAVPAVQAHRRWLVLAAAIALVLAGLVASLTIRRAPARPSTSPVRSIAVLPFKPIVAAQGDEALQVGMADTLIARISRIRGIAVRPLTAVRRYTSLDQDAIEAGRELRVDAVLDGSIHNANGRIHVNARLLRVGDGRQIWQGEFDERAGDLFTIQDSLSSRLVEALSLNLSPLEKREVRKRDTANLEAYRSYTVARAHWLHARSDEFGAAVTALKRAIALDPKYAQAWALLGNIYSRYPISSDAPPTNFDLALEASTTAIKLDPRVSLAWTNVAVVDFMHRWDWTASESHFRRAIELDPKDAWAHLYYAHLLSNLGRHEQAQREAAAALQLEPVTAHVNALAGQFLMQAGDDEGAIRQTEYALILDPNNWIARTNLAKIAEAQHRYKDALVGLETASRSAGTSLEPLAFIGHVYAVEGHRTEAVQVLSRLEEMSTRRYVPASKIAMIYAGLNQPDEAIRWLRKACTERDLFLTFLNVNPRWDALRSDPRFGEIERCVGLPSLVPRAAVRPGNGIGH